ncbi:bifunctional adenosylcobinamide kinase/adenosylcobinamide-phosphate guanylyltransferase [Meiothermus taiwanensis]|jgi:adenosylcobinamide kinase/adenosylcobinamide-phosphate guanylyltransferase|uniref:Adenosylcobinamide kinase n=2 Tax=Meiothermus taiwanensis TaxID=172827 RepID=A0A399E563_9DEIN|nr:bifunctional adenosylcobinamide kinase/adenosylcobinamide-phosphate guanylyltransferase [Meiothermus taiwanensis]AWR87837.1 adenosylcobinamide-phosphateguanylyltransferase [Meiothermus taiwanensis WR-220]KIQ53774.1 cobalamin biosynthesis protein [Meiothermus taiwanensis]KZK15436.1 bifunctional adenosylcobinamide kinase/adenosylcobinamide-phosphate guanylyltransferase [Meiothermus taiwanensis]RIH79874.1 Bifunctional adenosylcobalamin biosynthesis protein CobP [Meiothermus taiwanensis]
MQNHLLLITGGARAGKSRFAQAQAWALGQERVSFIATAQPLDEEMRQRIAQHRAERPPAWETLEAPLEVPQALERARHGVVLLDCLTLWVSNLMLAGLEVEPALEHLLAVRAQTGKTLLVVTNEVGLGIVPDNPLARRYRDLLGAANARVAQEAQRVYLLVAGIPLQIK